MDHLLKYCALTLNSKVKISLRMSPFCARFHGRKGLTSSRCFCIELPIAVAVCQRAVIRDGIPLPVALLIGLLQARRSNYENIDWTMYVVVFAFLSSFAMVFTPVWTKPREALPQPLPR
jgi:hypothetical protein